MDLILKLRTQKAWTQEHLAAVAGIGKATVQRIENGTLVPSVDTAKALAQVLDVAPDLIRRNAGLQQRVSLLLTALSAGRELSERDLRGLPPALRKAFGTCCKADSHHRTVQAATSASSVQASAAAAHHRALIERDAPWAELHEAGQEWDRCTRIFFDLASEHAGASLAGMEAHFALLRCLNRFA